MYKQSYTAKNVRVQDAMQKVTYPALAAKG